MHPNGCEFDRYLVLEIPEVVQRFAESAYGSFEFDTFDSALGSKPGEAIDVLYCNSALQYAADNQDLLTTIADLQPRLVMLDQLLWSRRDVDWFSIQTNSDIPLIVRFISLNKLTQELAEAGFDIAWSSPFSGVNYSFASMSGFDEVHAIPYAMSLLLYSPRREVSSLPLSGIG
jgi:putative methyltransferase (TIGR04325 family)